MFAADIPLSYWDRPGAASWRGTDERAFELLAQATGVSAAVLADLPRHVCRLRSVHEDERFVAMVFGRDEVERNVVARPSRWPTSASRLVLECGDGLGNIVLRPVACGNWSYERGPGGAWLPPAGGPELAWLPPITGVGEGSGPGWIGYGGAAIPIGGYLAAYEIPGASTPGGAFGTAEALQSGSTGRGETIPVAPAAPPPTFPAPEPGSLNLLAAAMAAFLAVRIAYRFRRNPQIRV